MHEWEPIVDRQNRILAAFAEDSGESPLLPPSLHAVAPLTEPAAELAAKLGARSGQELALSDHPRGRQWHRVVVPAGTVAFLCAAATGVFAVAGGWVGIALAGSGTIATTVTAVWSAVYVLRDPLRLSARERRDWQRARSWHSGQPWSATLSAGPERRLVSAACLAVGRILASPAWHRDTLDEHRLQLDLRAELDGIDQQAFTLATAKTPLPAALTDALIERVTALGAYADQLDAVKPHHPVSTELPAKQPAELPEQQTTELLAGSVRDEYATGQLTSLTADLRGITSSGESRTSAD
ncbi:hypothetical protein [Fodinicola feengrottensis]|uniref:SLATT domain-containing protein n=1 Tax=Fodinicola feengrottensis TaxID=435914 RepID=A0ABN2H753_9ACTN|nr:hypothetical protein [Fodinicola feengrottensis]